LSGLKNSTRARESITFPAPRLRNASWSPFAENKTDNVELSQSDRVWSYGLLYSRVMGLGEALSLACALNWAFVLILFRHVGRSVHPFALNLFKNIAAFVLFVFTILLWHGPHVPEIATVDVGRLLLSGFLGLGVADTLIFTALNVLGAGLLSIVECLYSPFVILFSLVWLQESLSAAQAAGCALVIGAVSLASATENARSVPRRDLIRGVAIGAAAMRTSCAPQSSGKPGCRSRAPRDGINGCDNSAAEPQPNPSRELRE